MVEHRPTQPKAAATAKTASVSLKENSTFSSAASPGGDKQTVIYLFDIKRLEKYNIKSKKLTPN
jgi:hypothetical protein